MYLKFLTADEALTTVNENFYATVSIKFQMAIRLLSC